MRICYFNLKYHLKRSTWISKRPIELILGNACWMSLTHSLYMISPNDFAVDVHAKPTDFRWDLSARNWSRASQRVKTFMRRPRNGLSRSKVIFWSEDEVMLRTIEESERSSAPGRHPVKRLLNRQVWSSLNALNSKVSSRCATQIVNKSDREVDEIKTLKKLGR